MIFSGGWAESRNTAEGYRSCGALDKNKMKTETPTHGVKKNQKKAAKNNKLNELLKIG